MKTNQKEIFKNGIERNGMTVKELASSIGITRQSISALLNGHKNITIERFDKYCEVLKTESCRLLGAFLSDKAAELKRRTKMGDVNKRITVTLEAFSEDGEREFLYKRDV